MSVKSYVKGLLIGLAIVLAFVLGSTISGGHTQAQKAVEPIKLGTAYKRGELSLKVTSYKTGKHENYVITTNLKKKNYYQVGSNDDKKGRTKGVTVAYGYDQR